MASADPRFCAMRAAANGVKFAGASACGQGKMEARSEHPQPASRSCPTIPLSAAMGRLRLTPPKKEQNKKDPHPTFSRKREKAQKAEEGLPAMPEVSRVRFR